VEFDWTASWFRRSHGPYCQNAHVRCCGIMRKFSGTVTAEVDFSVLSSDEEFDLIKRLGELPGVTAARPEEYEPSVIANYMLELAMALNVFLARYRVLGEEPRSPGPGLSDPWGEGRSGACLRMLGMEVWNGCDGIKKGKTAKSGGAAKGQRNFPRPGSAPPASGIRATGNSLPLPQGPSFWRWWLLSCGVHMGKRSATCVGRRRPDRPSRIEKGKLPPPVHGKRERVAAHPGS